MSDAHPIAPVRFNPPQGDGRDVEALTVEDLKGRAPEEFFRRLQRADFFRLIGLTKGESTPMVDFTDHPLRPMDWLLVRPGQVFRYDFSRPWSGWMLVFRPEALRAVAGGAAVGDLELLARVDALATHLRLEGPSHGALLHSLQQMHADGVALSDSSARSELLRLQLRVSLWRLSLASSAGAAGAGPQANPGLQARYAQFQRLLESRFATDHRVGQYADALGMGDKTLGRLCLAVAGMTPKALINQRLALEAKRLLAHTPMTVQRMALELGFVDAAHFGKFFRKEVGQSAQAFRRSQAGAGPSG